MPRSSPFGPPEDDRGRSPAAEPKQPSRFLDRMPPRWILLILLCGVLIVRGRVMVMFSDSLFNDPDGYDQIAERIYSNGAIAVDYPYSPFYRLTAYRPPLYPLMLAVFQGVETKHHLVGFLHVLLGVGTVWAVFRLGRLWGLPPGGSLLAAVLVTFDPSLLNQSVQVMTETLAAFLTAVALVAITRCARDASIGWSLLAGCLFGLCVLCRPTFLAWLVVVVIVLPFCVVSGRRRALGVATALVGAAAVALSPWAIRNQIVFGRPIVTTTHGGYTLLLGNNPEFYKYLREGAWGSAWRADGFNSWWSRHFQPANGWPPPTPDELAMDAQAYQLAFESIRDEPLMFGYACLVRVGRLWGVLPHQLNSDESTAHVLLRYAIALWYAVELLLAATGIWVLRKRFLRSPWIWGALLFVSFSAVHTFYWTDLRMRAPLESVVALLAARGAVAMVAARRGATPLPGVV